MCSKTKGTIINQKQYPNCNCYFDLKVSIENELKCICEERDKLLQEKNLCEDNNSKVNRLCQELDQTKKEQSNAGDQIAELQKKVIKF